MKILFSCLAFLAAVATVRGICTTDLSTICNGIKCSSRKDCNVKVCDPCDRKIFYTCAAQGRIPGIHLVSQIPERCPCGLDFSCDLHGCTIPNGELCTTQEPRTEAITHSGLSCYRAGKFDDSVGPYVREYKAASTYDKYVEVIDGGLEYVRLCPSGTRFVFDYCQCITCPLGMNCLRGSENDFCIDWDTPAKAKGIWIDRLDELPTAVGKHGLGGHFNGSQWLSLLYFSNNQRSKFTWHGWFKRDSSHGGLQGIVSNGDDKHPSSMDITSDGTLLTGSISTETSHMISSVSVSKAHLDGDWHFFAFVYNGTHLTIEIDGLEILQIVIEPGFTDRNDCPLSIGRYIDSSNIEYFFVGDLDEVCFYSVALSKAQLDTIRAGGVSDYPAPV